MKRSLQFHTGLHTSDWHLYPRPPYNGRGWLVTFVKPASEFPRGGEIWRGRHYSYKEVIVSARDQATAQRATNMIYNAKNLLQGWNLFGMFSSGPQPVSPVLPSNGNRERESLGTRPGFHATPDIPLACLVAVRISHKLKFVYALARLALSLEIISVPTIELDPTHSPNIPKSRFPEDHVRMAMAITSAYSAIEELGLAINASNKNPSRINGAWNPTVRSDLETRLSRAGVNVGEEFYWNLRGKRTRIEIRRTPEITELARWAIKNVVRDGKMHISDAIAYASFLRSQIATHGQGDKRFLKVLSVYEVANVQFLARRLLLESTGFWRYLGADHPRYKRMRPRWKRQRMPSAESGEFLAGASSNAASDTQNH